LYLIASLLFGADTFPCPLTRDCFRRVNCYTLSLFATILSTMRATTAITSLAIFLFAITAKTSASEEDNAVSTVDTEEGFSALQFGEGDFPLLELLPIEIEKDAQPANDAVSSSLRGNSKDSLNLPPIPPIHPIHDGAVVYSSMMEADGTITYRRDIHAPCDNGMLLFNVGPSKDELPYHYDLYGDAYLWSDNGGLCILYPTYTGYQTSTYGPFWRPGMDPTTVKFTNLIAQFKAMHRISSRVLAPKDGAPDHSKEINRNRAGDYIIMAKHDFYTIDYYKGLKAFVNSWGPNGWKPEDSDNADGWVVLDATIVDEPTSGSTPTDSLSEVQEVMAN